jgi:hypothetical protein
MLGFFARHDPAGYLSAGLLGMAIYGGRGSPSVNAASEQFFRERGIAPLAPNPRYATPEKTWNEFLNAAKAGDSRAMLDCLTADMQRKFAPILEKMSPAELRAMAGAVVDFQLRESHGDFRDAAVVRLQGDRRVAGIITFLHDGGDWKIAEM